LAEEVPLLLPLVPRFFVASAVELLPEEEWDLGGSAEDAAAAANCPDEELVEALAEQMRPPTPESSSNFSAIAIVELSSFSGASSCWPNSTRKFSLEALGKRGGGDTLFASPIECNSSLLADDCWFFSSISSANSTEF
jgi:hypothetical protein